MPDDGCKVLKKQGWVSLPIFAITCSFLLLCLSIPVFSSLKSSDRLVSTIETSERVVAFGDVHGAHSELMALLRELGMVDTQGDWIGGKSQLVSLGDLIDRGPGSRDVVELMIKLDRQATQAGGAVHMVLGNHEVMVMSGDLRYVSLPEFEAFAADESPQEREQMFQEYQRFNKNLDAKDLEVAFDREYPLGYLGLRKAYSPDGELGQWLLQQALVLKVNDRVYTHGGISDDYSGKSIDSINRELKEELNQYLNSVALLRKAAILPWHIDYHHQLSFLNARVEEFVEQKPRKRPDWFDAVQTIFEAQKYKIFSAQSPTWYRGTSLCHPLVESVNIERFLKRAGARQLIVGHTPTRGDVLERMDGLSIRLDTGMLKNVYKGQAAALVITPDQTYVHYLGKAHQAAPSKERWRMTANKPGQSDAELELFMRQADVTGMRSIGTGITRPKRVTLSREGEHREAAFKFEDTDRGLESAPGNRSKQINKSDRYIYDIAAYKLDRMLGLEVVPTAVDRVIEGRSGALVNWISNAIDEQARREQTGPFPGHCSPDEQNHLRAIFDILIYNEDRNLTNTLWTKNDYMIRLIDHSRAFRLRSSRPSQYRNSKLRLSDLFRARLQQLNIDDMNSVLSPYLHQRQIDAILRRRDLILK